MDERIEFKSATLSHQETIFKASFFSVWQICGSVEPDKIEFGQFVLVPDQRRVDMVDCADQMKLWMRGQLGQNSLKIVTFSKIIINQI